MILFISNPGEDYHDAIYYGFKKVLGADVCTYPDKPNYSESGPETWRNCHYTFTNSAVTMADIEASHKSGQLRAIFIISSGYAVWETAKTVIDKLKPMGKTFPIIIIDGADGDRIQYHPDEFDLYFAREYHVGSVRHELTHYPDFQRDALIKTGRPPDRVYPLPFCIIPEKFPASTFTPLKRDVFFRGAYGKQRAKYLEGVFIPDSLIDIHYHSPIHTQNRNEFFDLIRSSKININITAGGNDCMRFWELLGAGGFVLTEKHDQVIEPAFKEKIHLDTFTTKEEMFDKIAFYLKHEHIRERVRQQGYEFAMKNHTCYNRMDYIISKAKENGWSII